MARLDASGGSAANQCEKRVVRAGREWSSYLLRAVVIARQTETRRVGSAGAPALSNPLFFAGAEARIAAECRNNSGQGRQSEGTILPDGCGRVRVSTMVRSIELSEALRKKTVAAYESGIG
ncbi:hypothetical protein L3Q82_020679, partial [Scortum barcoo]